MKNFDCKADYWRDSAIKDTLRAIFWIKVGRIDRAIVWINSANEACNLASVWHGIKSWDNFLN